MYEIRFADGYEKRAIKFLKKHQDLYDKYKKTIQILENNPMHPSLRLHKLEGKLNQFSSVSISINMKYRIVLDFIIVNDVIILIDIGSHDDVY